MEERIIIALDCKEEAGVKTLVEKLGGKLVYVKVGMELYYKLGPGIITWLKARGLKIFLDLKLHDIPNTVYGGISSLLPLGIDMINVHASGGKQMMEGAKKAIDEFSGTKPLLIAVTQLTSTSKQVMNDELGIAGNVESQVLNQARLTQMAGLDGVVCSALEVKKMRQELGNSFVLVTPGIRSHQSSRNDQARVATPKEAFEWGASYIVVGREVTRSNDPLAAFESILKEVR